MNSINSIFGINEPWTCKNCDNINDGNIEICKSCGLHKDAFNDDDEKTENEWKSITNVSCATNNDAEKTLATIAGIILWVGIILSAICLIGGIVLIVDREEAGIILLGSLIPILLTTLLSWAIMKVLCNISNNLHEINQKIK